MNIRKGDTVRLPHYGVGRVVKGDHVRIILSADGEEPEYGVWNEMLVKFGRWKPSVWCEKQVMRVVRRGGGR